MRCYSCRWRARAGRLRKTALGLVVLVLTCWGSSLARSGDEAADGPAAPQPLEERVNEAVSRGAAWLMALQNEDGTFGSARSKAHGLDLLGMEFGDTAFAAYALAHCRSKESDRAVRRATRHLRKRYKDYLALPTGSEGGGVSPSGKMPRTYATYSLSVCLLLLEKTRGRGGDGAGARPPAWVRLMAKHLAAQLLEYQSDAGLWSYPRGELDVSNTQFAMLGLFAASELGVKVPEETVMAAAESLIQTQESVGPPAPRAVGPNESASAADSAGPGGSTVRDSARGFPYRSGGSLCRGSTTAAGVCALIVCDSLLAAGNGDTASTCRNKASQGVYDGLAWLAKTFDVTCNPTAPWRNTPDPSPKGFMHCYLYGMERACTMMRADRLGTQDWYRSGAEQLVGAQRADGSWWSTPEDGIPPGSSQKYAPENVNDTCFALLFLHRTSLRPEKPCPPPRTATTPR